LQSLRNHHPGLKGAVGGATQEATAAGGHAVEKVLVIGASGGCGSAAVQLAKALGVAEVVAVCSGKNRAVCLEMGANTVVDYTTQTLADAGPPGTFDLVYDTATGSGAGEDYTADAMRLLRTAGTSETAGHAGQYVS
jgi:NADPH:quinone reductase-like Zn-dependent oxidoreductase